MSISSNSLSRVSVPRLAGFAWLPLLWLLICLGTGGGLIAKSLSQASESQALPAEQVLQTKNIEDVKAGDRVWAYDTARREWSDREVLKPLVHDYQGDLVTVTVNGHSVVATGTHPFWVVAGDQLVNRVEAVEVPDADRHPAGALGKWVAARDLEAGDVLVLRDGHAAPIEMVTVRRASAMKVYNIKVADLHTYAVGDLGIAVHNRPCFPPGTLVLMGDGSTKSIEKIRVGDYVLARDPESGSSARPCQVSALIRDFADGLVHVKFRSPTGSLCTITSTQFHPFWTFNRNWVEARDLASGDQLDDPCGSSMVVVSVDYERNLGKSHNLTIDEIHTYFVVADGIPILVHNAPIPDPLVIPTGDREVSLYKAPPPSRPQSEILNELTNGFDPNNYPGDGPFFARNLKAAADFQFNYQNGMQTFTMPEDSYLSLINNGVIVPDPNLPPGEAVHVPPKGLDKFNEAIKEGSPNTYKPERTANQTTRQND